MSRRFRELGRRSTIVAALAALLVLMPFLAACGAGAMPAAVKMTITAVPRASTPTPWPTQTPAAGPTATGAPLTEPVAVPTAGTPLPAPTLSVADAVQAELARLETGRILYNPPDEMKVGTKERIEVRISMGTDAAAPLDQGLKGTGAPQVETIPVGSFMKVRLVGESFTIVEFSSEEQIVPARGYTEWAWDVTPKESGERTLAIIVTARVKVPGYADEQKDLPIIERQIDVKVSPGVPLRSFLSNNQDWVIPSLLVPLAAALGRWLWRFLRRRKQTGHPGAGGDAAGA